MVAEKPTRSPNLQWPKPLAGLRGTKVADLPREIPAGITLAAMIIPLNTGFTQVAGLPPTGRRRFVSLVSPVISRIVRAA